MLLCSIRVYLLNKNYPFLVNQGNPVSHLRACGSGKVIESPNGEGIWKRKRKTLCKVWLLGPRNSTYCVTFSPLPIDRESMFEYMHASIILLWDRVLFFLFPSGPFHWKPVKALAAANVSWRLEKRSVVGASV